MLHVQEHSDAELWQRLHSVGQGREDVLPLVDRVSSDQDRFLGMGESSRTTTLVSRLVRPTASGPVVTRSIASSNVGRCERSFAISSSSNASWCGVNPCSIICCNSPATAPATTACQQSLQADGRDRRS